MAIDGLGIHWTPFRPSGAVLRVKANLGQDYEFCAMGGLWLVLRHRDGRTMEAGRGGLNTARAVWDEIILADIRGHLPSHPRK
ncbi:hypothetical protein [Planomonospora venezuelensis]|uniref:Uncharacterized protein n=1 Tax=Planomonospora venezuelensis TaxID=1999 RepID=A0A841DA80_PLAVE|nr:hypothetical protein [Planomonospora venezuelensis]MBB5965035.1 hypothetical protein [Planomonospora venezuelensis]GIM62712.1 hypothetical protein Pve01_78280 [Planomonospora venezuelensis]